MHVGKEHHVPDTAKVHGNIKARLKKKKIINIIGYNQIIMLSILYLDKG